MINPSPISVRSLATPLSQLVVRLRKTCPINRGPHPFYSSPRWTLLLRTTLMRSIGYWTRRRQVVSSALSFPTRGSSTRTLSKAHHTQYPQFYDPYRPQYIPTTVSPFRLIPEQGSRKPICMSNFFNRIIRHVARKRKDIRPRYAKR